MGVEKCVLLKMTLGFFFFFLLKDITAKMNVKEE